MSIASHLTSSTSRSLALSFLSIVSLVSVLVELDNIGLPLVGLDHGEPRGEVLVDAELLAALADSFSPFLTQQFGVTEAVSAPLPTIQPAGGEAQRSEAPT